MMFISGILSAVAFGWTLAAEAQQVRTVVRTFRPDPNWPRETIPERHAGQLVFVFQEELPVEEFVRSNRCVVGRWVFERVMDGKYYGYLRYANANDDPLGVRELSGPYLVQVPDGVEFDLGMPLPQWADVVVLRAVAGTTVHELVAHNGEPQAGQPWLPRSIANTTTAYWGSRDYAYRGGVE